MNEERKEESPILDRRLVNRLIPYLRSYKLLLGAAVAILLVMSGAIAFLPVLIRSAIDQFLVTDSALTVDDRIRGLTRLSSIFIGLAAFGFGLRFVQSYLMVWVGQQIIRDLRRDIFRKILRLPLAFFDRTPVGRLITRTTSDVEHLQRFVTDGLVGLAADLFMLLGVMVFAFYLSVKLAVTLFVILPLLFVALTIINANLRRAQRDVLARQSDKNAYLQESLTGMTTLQLFGREVFAQQQFEKLNGKLRAAFMDSVRWYSYYFPTLEVTNALAVALVMVVGAWDILSAHSAGVETTSSIGVITAFIMFIREFFRPLEDLSEKASVFQQAMASAERIFSLIDTPEDILDPDRPIEITSFHGRVEFDSVRFAYEQDNWVLNDISLQIDPGESVALVGATGAGKTSIISLMARFYDIQHGSIRLDGHDIRALRQRDLRRRIGIVLQDPYIFPGTIASNIDLYNPEISRGQVVQAARFVNAHAFIERLPKGYDAELTERGDTLSTGQKQLLALARALAQNPDILIILDEATANVDTETELLIQDAMSKLMHGRTSIIIAHRLSTIRHVDRIYVMRHGDIVERGSHAELIRADGYYKHLCELMAKASGNT